MFNIGVPRGSILGHLLWNMIYDGVLKIEKPEDTMIIAHAYYLSVVIKAKTQPELEEKINKLLEDIHK